MPNVRSFATDQYDPLGENYICDHCDPLLRKMNHPSPLPCPSMNLDHVPHTKISCSGGSIKSLLKEL